MLLSLSLSLSSFLSLFFSSPSSVSMRRDSTRLSRLLESPGGLVGWPVRQGVCCDGRFLAEHPEQTLPLCYYE